MTSTVDVDWWCDPEEIAQVRPRLPELAGGSMLAGALPRKAAGQASCTYGVWLTDGEGVGRCSRRPSGSGWSIRGCSGSSRPRYGTTAAVRANVARWGVQAVVPHAYHHQGAHIARHDPARVLAECEAKRRIVEEYRHWQDEMDRQGSTSDMRDLGVRDGLEMACELLALPYADHEHFREEWKL